MPRIKVLIAGCGRIGSDSPPPFNRIGASSHAEAFLQNDRFLLVGMADTSSSARSRARERWGVETYADWCSASRDLQPEVLSICTPDSTHGEIALQALELPALRLLIVEKPLALDWETSARIAIKSREKQIPVLVNYSRRFSAVFQRVREMWQQKLFGEPHSAFIRYGKGWRHNATHAVDLLRFWFGEPEDVLSVYRHPQSDYPGDASLDVSMKFRCGLRAYMQSVSSDIASIFEGDFIGTKARIRFVSGGSKWEFYNIDQSERFIGYREFSLTVPPLQADLVENSMQDCLTNLVKVVQQKLGGEPLPFHSIEDSVETVRWVEAAAGYVPPRTCQNHLQNI